MVYGAISKNDRKYYTFLNYVFKAIGNKQNDYNRLITNCECYPDDSEIQKMFNDKEYTWISGEELTKMVWGVGHIVWIS